MSNATATLVAAAITAIPTAVLAYIEYLRWRKQERAAKQKQERKAAEGEVVLSAPTAPPQLPSPREAVRVIIVVIGSSVTLTLLIVAMLLYILPAPSVTQLRRHVSLLDGSTGDLARRSASTADRLERAEVEIFRLLNVINSNREELGRVEKELEGFDERISSFVQASTLQDIESRLLRMLAEEAEMLHVVAGDVRDGVVVAPEGTSVQEWDVVVVPTAVGELEANSPQAMTDNALIMLNTQVAQRDDRSWSVKAQAWWRVSNGDPGGWKPVTSARYILIRKR